MTQKPTAVALDQVEVVPADEAPTGTRIARLVTRAGTGSSVLVGVSWMDPGGRVREVDGSARLRDRGGLLRDPRADSESTGTTATSRPGPTRRSTSRPGSPTRSPPSRRTRSFSPTRSTRPRADAVSRPAGRPEHDIAVIGAGIVGLASALQLLRHRRTLKLVVIDARATSCRPPELPQLGVSIPGSTTGRVRSRPGCAATAGRSSCGSPSNTGFRMSGGGSSWWRRRSVSSAGWMSSTPGGARTVWKACDCSRRTRSARSSRRCPGAARSMCPSRT